MICCLCMLINIIPPKCSLRNCIVNVLLYKKEGCEIKEIKRRLKLFDKTATYHGIHKILKYLVDEDIVLRVNHIWKINPLWIENISKMHQHFKNNTILYYHKEMTSVSFSTIAEAFAFIRTNIENESLRNNGEHLFITHVKNVGFFVLNKKEREFLKRFIKKTTCIILIEKDNFINRLCAKYLTSFGCKVVTGIVRSTPYTTTVYGNTVYYTHATGNLIDYMFKKYTSIKKISDKAALELFDSFKENKQFAIKFTFETDQQIVEQTKKYLLQLIPKK